MNSPNSRHAAQASDVGPDIGTTWMCPPGSWAGGAAQAKGREATFALTALWIMPVGMSDGA